MKGSFFCFRCPYCSKLIQQRTERQNNKFHGACTLLSKSQEWPEGSGLKRSVKFWKLMLVNCWQRAHGREAAAVPALDGIGEDGCGVDFIHTSKFPVQEMDALIAYAENWMAVHGGAS